jgi:hypothetical protein
MRKKGLIVLSGALAAVAAVCVCVSVFNSGTHSPILPDSINIGTAAAAGSPSAEKIQGYKDSGDSRPLTDTKGQSAEAQSSASEPDGAFVPDTAAIERLINLNRVYGEFINDDNALIEEAEVVLLDRAEEHGEYSVIKKDLVNAFIYNVYGREVDPSAGKYEMYSPPEGYYAILPRGYSMISHKVTGISRLANGNVEVRSDMFVSFYDESDATELSLITVLKPSDTSIYGYNIISAQIAEDLQDSGLSV